VAHDDDTLHAQTRHEPMSFAAARAHAVTLAVDATPAQRLAWLEEAIEIAYASGALPRRPNAR
jgi:hypothetical protein